MGEPEPGRFSRLVVKWPLGVMFFTGLAAVVLAMLAFTAGEAELGGDSSSRKAVTTPPAFRRRFAVRPAL